ncbi:8-oxo-dGTP pyrophosphatase MutT, NUDIX family [Paracoccus isoporae]|uniref:8-oxo-dGTP pyrophosphatase MutT, NUDIX family n=1 Tax=Paracoccus isoporae TaxID=591205 RepID=A0A1G6Z7E0_9RHOB|nr:CoA pyrophosphatase [Paracoccus isoporae]SDD98558.1 8-oxo-dGTP pyrophosphatase MutT, NUDIX family [Paracoccus isoporae]
MSRGADLSPLARRAPDRTGTPDPARPVGFGGGISGADLSARLTAALRHDTPPSSDFEPDSRLKPPEDQLRAAGVLLAFHEADGRLFLTKRAATMRHHPGQISLPGGKVDPGDADARAAALREAHEEIGLDPAQLRIIGTLPPHRTVTLFRITPLVAVIRGPFAPRPEPGEVAEAFTLPFAHIADPANYRREGRVWRGQWRPYLVAPYGPYYLWGATARILFGLAQRLAQ